MVTKAPPELITADDLLKLSADGFYGELVRGELCEDMPPGVQHAEIVARLIALLFPFVDARKLGRVMGDGGVRIERAPDTVRAPDLAFFALERLPAEVAIPGYADVVPNLVVEVQSPNDGRWKLHDKAHMWLYYGAEAVWVVQPESRSVDVYRSGRNTIRLSGTDSLEGLDVLPGFSCELEAIFGPQPEPTLQEAGDQSTAGAS